MSGKRCNLRIKVPNNNYRHPTGFYAIGLTDLRPPHFVHLALVVIRPVHVSLRAKMFCLRRYDSDDNDNFPCGLESLSPTDEFANIITSVFFSWLPLLFIPTNASPLFIVSFITLTYLLHRPCIYCSALLLILFLSSCHWSDRCFFDFRGDWFSPRFSSPPTIGAPATPTKPQDSGLAEYVLEAVNTTAAAVAGAAFEEAKRRLLPEGMANARTEWTGMGVEWLRSLLGRREWTLPCVDVKVRL
jgi:hypothetical protein